MLDCVPPPHRATGAVRDMQLASTHDWRYVHNVDLTLYAKADVVDFFIDAPLANPADAESAPTPAASALTALGPPVPHLLLDLSAARGCGLAVAVGQPLDRFARPRFRTRVLAGRLGGCRPVVSARQRAARLCAAVAVLRRLARRQRRHEHRARRPHVRLSTGGRTAARRSRSVAHRVQRAVRDAAWDDRMCASARRGRRAPAMAGRPPGQCIDCVVHAMVHVLLRCSPLTRARTRRRTRAQTHGEQTRHTRMRNRYRSVTANAASHAHALDPKLTPTYFLTQSACHHRFLSSRTAAAPGLG